MNSQHKIINVFNNFYTSVNIIEYCGCIFDMKSLSICCSELNNILLNQNKCYDYLRSIVTANLQNIFYNEFNIDILIFKDFCKTINVILGGSIMLKSITGSNWGHNHDYDNQDNKFIAINDIDVYLDNNINNIKPETYKFSEIVRNHNYNFDRNQFKKENFIRQLISFIKLHSSDPLQIIRNIEKTMKDNYNIQFLIDLVTEGNCYNFFITIIDAIYEFRYLFLPSEINNKSCQLHEIITNLEDENNIPENENNNYCHKNDIPLIVINLKTKTINSNKKGPNIQIIIGHTPLSQVFDTYDFPFLGSSIDFRKNNISNIDFKKTIYYILTKNKNILYQSSMLKIQNESIIITNINQLQLIEGRHFLVNMNTSMNENEKQSINSLIKKDHNIRFKLTYFYYRQRLLSNYNLAYIRMKKYYYRGFFTFDSLNINNNDFLNDMNSFHDRDFIRLHMMNGNLYEAFRCQLTKNQLEFYDLI